MQKQPIYALLLAALLAGCYTISETPAPTITCHANASVATNLAVSVRGFTTTLTEYTTATGHQTIFFDPGPGVCGPGIATAQSTTIIPLQRRSDAFLEQAQNRLESIGFNIMSPSPDYLVDASFSGPETSAGDTASSVAWFLCTLLTCDHGAQTWRARLKIHDNHTGRLIFSRDYEQKYEVTGFSPIPLLGISSYERTSSNYMQCWCLSVLTERIAADTATFLTSPSAPL